MMEGTKECLIETGHERISDAYVSCVKDVSEEDQEEVVYEEFRLPGSDNGDDDVAQNYKGRTKVEDYLSGYHYAVTSKNDADGEIQQDQCPQISKRRLFYDVCPQCTFEDEIISDTSSLVSQSSFHVASRTGESQASQECQERSSSGEEVWSLHRKSSGSGSSNVDSCSSGHASPSVEAHHPSPSRQSHQDTPSLGYITDSSKVGSVIATKKSGFATRGEKLLTKRRSEHQPYHTDDRNHGEEFSNKSDCDSPCLAKVARNATRSSHPTVGRGRQKLRDHQVEWYAENGKIFLRDLSKRYTTTKRYIVDINIRAWMSPVNRWGQYSFEVPIFQHLHPADFLVDFTFEYWMPSEKPRYDIDLSHLQSQWYDGPNQVGGKFDCSDDLLLTLTPRADLLREEIETLIGDNTDMALEQVDIQVYSLTKVPSIDFHDTSIHEEVMRNGEPNDSAYVSAGGSQAPSEGSQAPSEGSQAPSEGSAPDSIQTGIDRQEPATNHVDVTSIAYFTDAVASVNELVKDQLVVSPINTSEAATSEEETWLPPSFTSNVDKAFSRAWLLDRQRRRRRGKEEKWRKQFISQSSDVKWYDIALALGAEDIESRAYDLEPSLGQWQREWIKLFLDFNLEIWYWIQAAIGAILGFIKRWSWAFIVFVLVWLLVVNSLMKVLVSYGVVERPTELIIDGHTYFLGPPLPTNVTPSKDWVHDILHPSTTASAIKTGLAHDEGPRSRQLQSSQTQAVKTSKVQKHPWTNRARDRLDRALGWTGEEL